MTASSSAVDPGLAIVEQLRSLSETPGLDMFLLQARNDEDVCSYLFSEEAHRIQLLKILFKKIDDTLEYSKKETEILETLQNLCIGCGFCNTKDSRSFVIGKMSVENQCRIWEKIMDVVKSITECDDVFDEVDNDVIKVQSFFKNPLLNDFLTLIPKATDRNLPLNHCDSENLDCEIENARLKLENYMEMEIPNPDQEPTSLESDSPSILPVDQLLDTIKKWEIGFQDHLEGNLSVTSPEKAAIDLANKESNKKISQSIRSLRACCSTIEKNIENRKLLTELEGRVRDTNKIEDEGSLS